MSCGATFRLNVLRCIALDIAGRVRGYKTFFMLVNAHKYKILSKSAFFKIYKPRMLFFCSYMYVVKMITIVGILTFMSRINFMLS